MMNNIHENWGDHIGTGMGLGMWALWIVIIVVVLAIKLFISSTHGRSATSTKSAFYIIDKRCAHGEPGRDEYEGMKNALENNSISHR